MKKMILALACLLTAMAAEAGDVPKVVEKQQNGYFPLVSSGVAASILTDAGDYAVVGIAAGMLADDVQRVTSLKGAMQGTP